MAAPPTTPAPTPSATPASSTPTGLSGLPTDGDTLTAPNTFLARDLAAETGQPVEALSERTPTESLFALPDGQWTWQQSMAPQLAQTSGDGTEASDWEQVDVRLAPNGDGSFSPIAHPDLVVIHGDAGEFLHYVNVESGADVRLSLGSGSVPEPVIDGGRATFPSIAAGTDLVVDVRPGGYEYFVVVHDKRAAATTDSIPLVLTVSGGEVVPDGSGGFELVSDAGEVIGSMPPASAWDAHDDLKGGSPVLDDWSETLAFAPVERAFRGVPAKDRVEVAREYLASGKNLQEVTTHDVTVELAPGDAVGSFDVGLGISPAWVNDPTTMYPLVIDPTGSFLPTFDAYVLNGNRADYSHSTDLLLGTYNSGSNVARTILNFQVPDLKFATVTNATLYMGEYWSWSCSPRQWNAYWSDPGSTATRWTNQGNIYGLYGSTTQTVGHDSGCNPSYVSMPLTSLVNGVWTTYGAGTTFGVQLRAANEADNYGWKRFYSSETSSPPVIYITATAPSPLVPIGITVDGKTLTASGRTDFTTARPVFSATVTDRTPVAPAVNRPLRAGFFLYRDGVLQNTEPYYGTTTAAGGGVSTWTPTFDLVPDAEYHVAVIAVYNDWAFSQAADPGSFRRVSVNAPSEPSGLRVNGAVVPTASTTPGTAVAPTRLPLSLANVRNILGPGDVNEDGVNDLLVWKTDYTLDLYLGDGAGGVLSTIATPVAGNWSSYNMVITPGDFNGDGHVDIITRDNSYNLHLHAGAGDGTFTLVSTTPIGTGWSFRDIISPGDFDKNGFNDLIAWGTNGYLYLYGRDANGWKPGYGGVIGTGWGGFSLVLTPGLFNTDSYNAPDLVAWTQSAGTLRLYYGTGSGLSGGTVMTSTWTDPSRVVSPGDFTGDGKSDVMKYESDGTLMNFAGIGDSAGNISPSGFAVTGPLPVGASSDLELTDSTPALSAVVGDPDGGQVRAVFSLYRSHDGENWELVRDDLYGTWVASGQRSYFRSTSSSIEPGLEGALLVGEFYRIEVRAQDASLLSGTALTTGVVTVAPPSAAPEVPSGCDSVVGTPAGSSTTCGLGG